MSGSGGGLPLVRRHLLFPEGQRVLLAEKKGGKNHRLSINAGLSKSLVALCLFFCHTKEWKGVFPQPVRQPSPVLSSEASSPLCSSAQHVCFLCLSFTGQGLPLSPEGGKKKKKKHVTLDPGKANGHYPVSSVSQSWPHR